MYVQYSRLIEQRVPPTPVQTSPKLQHLVVVHAPTYPSSPGPHCPCRPLSALISTLSSASPNVPDLRHHALARCLRHRHRSHKRRISSASSTSAKTLPMEKQRMRKMAKSCSRVIRASADVSSGSPLGLAVGGGRWSLGSKGIIGAMGWRGKCIVRG